MQVDRAVAIVPMQRAGVPVDPKENEKLRVRMDAETTAAKKGIAESKEARAFHKRFRRRFNPGSSKDMIGLLRDICDVELTKKTKGGSYATDEEVLRSFKDDVSVIPHILELRSLDKLKGTYVDRMRPDHEDPLVYPDGKLHCNFSEAFTRSGRLSSSQPNNQNWPKRDKRAKQVRKQIKAPPGHSLVAVDQGQIEARVLGMASRDERFCDALWNNLDVHMVWTEKIAKVWPKFLRRHDGSMKAARSSVKNEMVFPAFYLAGTRTISRYLQVPENVVEELFEEFWEYFEGIKAWQQQTLRFYAKHGYVKCLTGRRRQGPLSHSMIVNSPIQGAASDIVVDSMVRLSKQSRAMGCPHLQPVMNIHDDLTFIVPDSELDDAITEIVYQMLWTPPEWDWVNVPLSVEVEVGRHWAAMEEIGTFRSDEVL